VSVASKKHDNRFLVTTWQLQTEFANCFNCQTPKQIMYLPNTNYKEGNETVMASCMRHPKIIWPNVHGH